MSDYLNSSEYRAKDCYETAIYRLYEKKFGRDEYKNVKGCMFYFIRNNFMGIVKEIELFREEDTKDLYEAFDHVREVHDYVKNISSTNYKAIKEIIKDDHEKESIQKNISYKLYLVDSNCLSKLAGVGNSLKWHLSNDCYRIFNEHYSEEEKEEAKKDAEEKFTLIKQLLVQVLEVEESMKKTQKQIFDKLATRKSFEVVFTKIF